MRSRPGHNPRSHFFLDIETEEDKIYNCYIKHIFSFLKTLPEHLLMISQASPSQCLVDVAYDHLARRIVFMDYAPGQRLEEKQLMSDLKLGRTPIREALLRLHADMVVESRPKSGYFVRPITLQSIRSAFEALYLIEGGLAELAVKNDCSREMERMDLANAQMKEYVQKNDIRELVEANETFHAYLAQCSRNEYLIQSLSRVRTEIKRLAYLSFSQEIDPEHSLNAHYQSVLQEHEDMVQALQQRNANDLNELISVHIRTFQQRIMQSMMS